MTGRLTVCGLGPGDPGLVTHQTRETLAGASRVYLRTARHPSATVAGTDAVTLDHHYAGLDRFDEVYRAIVETLVAAAEADDGVVYAVPGSPLVLERTVGLLRADARVEVRTLPAVSFLDEVWSALAVDPVEDGVRLVDGHRFAVDAAGERGPLLVAHVHAPWVLSEIKLALGEVDDEPRVVVLQRLGSPDEKISEVAWSDLDRVVEPDHLTSLYLPELAEPVARELADAVALMHRLRQECPWDRRQDHRSLRRYLVEEAYEVLDAINGLPPGAPGPVNGDSSGGNGSAAAPLGSTSVEVVGSEAYAALEEELGDLLMQVLFHAELAAEAGQFGVAEVASGLTTKLIARHPHVFGDATATTSAELRATWDRIKAEEKRERSSVLDGVPRAMPALAWAAKLMERIDRSGVRVVAGDAGPQGAGAAASPEAETGDALLRMVVAARADGVDPESALRAGVAELDRRFRAAERAGTLGDRWVIG
ncbi:MAG: MazG nucleotide pyrophosphohydrolase domain-containing protein [Acidimicrobiales bacterium]